MIEKDVCHSEFENELLKKQISDEIQKISWFYSFLFHLLINFVFHSFATNVCINQEE
jgi:hypothetical protein